MEEKNESTLTRSVFRALQLTLVGFFATMIGGCTGAEDSPHKEAAMRNEIIAYVKSYDANSGEKGKDYRVDATHVVEKYIKMGDSYETAKKILLKNGFSVYEHSVKEEKKRGVKLDRMSAGSKIEGSRWWRRDIAIFLGKSPQSEKVDRILAKVDFKVM